MTPYLIAPADYLQLQDDGCPNCPNHLPMPEAWIHGEHAMVSHTLIVRFTEVGIIAFGPVS